ncbi:ATP-binding cassette domain-containing protein, partial [Mesorhizobium tamadayense]
RQVRAAAERVELGGLLERKPGQLSGGQRQRVALGRAIVRTPKLFLMDEPLSNLDAKLRVYMRAELKHLQRDLATTTIYVTHDQVEAMTLADRVAVMANGRLQQVGTPLDIYNTPANVFVAGFLGNPPMNLLPITIADGRVQDSELTLAAPAGVNGAITVGQRPEDMRLSETDAGNMAGEVYTTEL